MHIRPLSIEEQEILDSTNTNRDSKDSQLKKGNFSPHCHVRL